MSQGEGEQTSCRAKKDKETQQSRMQLRLHWKTPHASLLMKGDASHSLPSSGKSANDKGKKNKNECEQMLHFRTNVAL